MAKFFNCGALQMPSVGLGTWQSTNEEELEKVLDTALEIGYRHIDTAFAYNNEHVIGRVLKRWFESGKLKRQDIFLTTKCPLQGIHQNRVETYIKKSLERLQLEYVDLYFDLYLLHFPVGSKEVDGETVLENPTDHIAIWKVMEEQVEEGRAETIGLSNFNTRQIKRIFDSAMIPPANLQVELHVFLQQPELVKFCHDSDISVVAYSPLATPGYNDFMSKIGRPIKKVPDALNNPIVLAIAKKHGRTNAQILLRYLLQLDIAVIPKTVSPERVKQNFQLFDFSLDDEDVASLKKLDQGEKGRICDFNFFPGLPEHPEFPFK